MEPGDVKKIVHGVYKDYFGDYVAEDGRPLSKKEMTDLGWSQGKESLQEMMDTNWEESKKKLVQIAPTMGGPLASAALAALQPEIGIPALMLANLAGTYGGQRLKKRVEGGPEADQLRPSNAEAIELGGNALMSGAGGLAAKKVLPYVADKLGLEAGMQMLAKEAPNAAKLAKTVKASTPAIGQLLSTPNNFNFEPQEHDVLGTIGDQYDQYKLRSDYRKDLDALNQDQMIPEQSDVNSSPRGLERTARPSVSDSMRKRLAVQLKRGN